MTKHYINLTNGIEAIPNFNLSNYSFIRIQSTVCEQHLWDRLIMELDYDFLMNVAIGNECIIYDFGAKKPIPRAIYQGVEFIKFTLNKFWYGIDTEAYIIRHSYSKDHCDNKINVTNYFNEIFYSLSDQVKTKLKYFRPFLGGNVNIHCVASSTTHDGDKKYYGQLLRSNLWIQQETN